MLSREDLRERARSRRDPLSAHVESLDADVLVRPMCGRDLEEFLLDMDSDDRPDSEAYGLMRKWVARMVVGDDGAAFFSGPEDEILMELSIPQMLDLFESVAGAGGAQDVEAEPGKAGTPPDAGGGSASPTSGDAA